MTCIIISGGKLSAGIPKGDMIICADCGYDHALKLGVVPDIIVGDFDSCSNILPEDIPIVRSKPEKDDTDTIMAVRIALDKGADKIVICGALGGRFDHTFANIQTLMLIHSHGCKGSILDSGNIITAAGTGEHRYSQRKGWYFSIFALTAQVKIRELSGVKYPLRDYILRQEYPIGVSNEILSEARLIIESGTALVVHSRK